MASDFEKGLLPELRELIPDLEAEHRMAGFGKEWVANLYSEKTNLVIEACSRNVVRTGKARSSIQHYEKFYSMALKLVDIKTKHPEIKPVMIWQNLIPAHSTDLALCAAWGIYVLSERDLRIHDVLSGMPPSQANKHSLSFLSRRNEAVTPRWIWLVDERKNLLVSLLRQKAMGARQISEALGLDYEVRRSYVSRMLRDLKASGRIRRLMTGYVRGYGAIYGTSPSQLDAIEGSLFGGYKEHKRNQRIAERTVQLLREEGPLSYKEILKRLSDRWGLATDRGSILGILTRNLRVRGLVRAQGPPKKLRYFAV